MGKLSTFLKAKSVGEFMEASKNQSLQDEIDNRSKSDVLKNTVNKTPADNTERQLIKNGAMCPKCKSQDVMVIGGKRTVSGIVALGIFAKKHPEIVCKSCGNRWRVK